jgi:hypothetical protein
LRSYIEVISHTQRDPITRRPPVLL